MRMSKTDVQTANAAYEAVAARNGGRIESLDQVIAEIEIAMPAAAVDVLRQRYYRELAHAADDRALERAESGQMTLFDGDADALDGFFALGASRRVKVRVAVNDDWVTNLHLKFENANRVQQRYLAAQAEHSRLQPYLARGMTTEQAVTAYLVDHPKQIQATPIPAGS